VQRRESEFLQSDAGRLLVVVECHVQAVVATAVLVQRPTTNDAQARQRDVVDVAGDDQHVAGHLADVPQERQVVAGVRQKHQLQVAVDVRAVGVARPVLVVVTLRVRQALVRAATNCSQTDHGHFLTGLHRV